MLDSIFKTSEQINLTVGNAMLTLVIAFILGLIISITYIKTNSKKIHNQNFILTLVMISPIIAIIILLIGDNAARAFGLAGAFSIIRFRSQAGDPKDIAYVFFTMAAGLACGIGMFGYAALFTIFLCILTAILSFSNFGANKHHEKALKIVIPEDLDYHGVFDDLFEKYTITHELRRVKTTELGSLFELVYMVNMRFEANEKDFMDELRCRNGNLSIVLILNAERADY
ncbi:DUF4956 domain-containing protein [Pseudobacteroides cellulosolvens]|uniref:DUF4956 domain-containing protein n=1 Tax=Pseudobacteroides cellulosolvens ATCC 35603 = DSM 2933 TaxID=398512 RepID=A0A0L6JMS1_9FIRM|nr:DUF4956 domain-containing protein [Pseudobacteroides cellulosolvens]KNY26677.1 hypothetical protein Bccel_1942 [Pseudobacteroides cellulosolvens ATCC 35603 = DSM 2933]